MPLRSRRTASLNGFRHSKTRVSGSMYFRHLRDLRIIRNWMPLVQPRAATQCSGLPEPCPIPSATIKPGGLIVGERFASPRMVA